MPSVSVIMPLYNSAGFLPRAVESVLNQSFGDFELILINDGSTDASPRICEKYAAADDRVMVIHQPNAGCLINKYKINIRKTAIMIK